MSRRATVSGVLLVRLDPVIKAGIVEAARRLGVPINEYVTDLFEARDGKLLRHRRLDGDPDDTRKINRVRDKLR